MPSKTPAATPDATPAATASPAPTTVPEKTPGPSVVPENNPGKQEEENNAEENGPAQDGDSEGGDSQDSDSGDGENREIETDREILKKQPEESFSENRSEDENDGRLSYYEKRDRSAVQPRAEKEEVLASASPIPKEKVKKDTQTVTMPENKAAQESEYKVGQQTKRSGFLQSTAAKIITVTVSTLSVLAGIILLMLYLLCSVRIFNDDGEGRMVYLGRLLVRKKDGEYSLVITETMTEKSCTNRYCIKPGLFRLGKKEDQELVVCRDTKKAVASLSREMIVIL